jgi:hypothetical protein
MAIPMGMTIPEFWNRQLVLYDPAWSPYDTFPAGPADMVICTHVLGAIPWQDLDDVVSEIVGLANKAVYVAEKLQMPGKRLFEAINGSPKLYSRSVWEKLLRKHVKDGVEITLATREHVGKENIITRGVVK